MNGDTLVALDQNRKLVPASTMKLVTTGLALRTLGPDYRYRTSIAISGSVKDSTLVGDVYIIGGGDPTTGSSYDKAERSEQLFARWAGFLKNAGISRIQGRVIGDPRWFRTDSPENPGWSYEDIGTGYAPSPLGLNFFENVQTFYAAPGPVAGSRPYITPRYPDTPWMQYRNCAVTLKGAAYDELWYVNTPFGPYGEFRGSFPLGARGKIMECSNSFGAYTCAHMFSKYLKAKGISVSDGCADVTLDGYVRNTPAFVTAGSMAAAPASLKVLGSTQSPRLADIVVKTNHESDNFFAESLFLTLGKVRRHSSRRDSCAAAVNELLAEMGMRTANNFQGYDGSGLSRKNYVSPRFFVSFLRSMASSKVYREYFESLPIPGEEETSLSNRFPDADAAFKERIHMKSGSMNGVRCFAGYILTPDADPRHTVVFAVMTNNSIAGLRTVYHMVEDIIAAIAEEN